MDALNLDQLILSMSDQQNPDRQRPNPTNPPPRPREPERRDIPVPDRGREREKALEPPERWPEPGKERR